MEKTCPSCGAKERASEFVKNFCEKCFTANFPLSVLPDTLEIARCSVCGRIKFIDWIKENGRSLLEIIASKLKSNYNPVIVDVHFKGRRNAFDVSLTVNYTVEGKKIEQKEKTAIIFKQTQCFDCSRETGGYYDSIIQLRFKEETPVEIEKLEAKLKRLEKLLVERGGRINKIETTKTGLDVFVSGITPAMQASNLIGDKVLHTRKLVGKKKGKDLFRHTFCIRF